jgi:hypothetical protein
MRRSCDKENCTIYGIMNLQTQGQNSFYDNAVNFVDKKCNFKLTATRPPEELTR